MRVGVGKKQDAMKQVAFVNIETRRLVKGLTKTEAFEFMVDSIETGCPG
jgi:hypothetical protein